MARKPPKGKSLAEVNPELAKQWHSTKNGDLTPLDIFLKSNKPFWWKCQKGIDHEWESSPNNRNGGSGCPVCSGYKAVKSNCLATTHPDLAEEWHPTKNENLTPDDVTSGSGKDIWWKCDKGDDHEWVSTVNNRKNGNGCSICSAKQVVKSNSLATTHPNLAKEWHLTKNGDLTPNDVTYGSDKKIWWKCDKGDDHEWITTVSHRSRGRRCPVCSGDKLVKSNCLATTHPKIANQWHPTKNGELTPNDVSYGSNKDIWWKCDKGDDHEWRAKVSKRSGVENCTICSGRKLAKSNSLATTHPDIANQWHPTLNHPITPNQTTKGRTDYYWWKCDKGEDHIWEASPNNRTRGKGCPICSGNMVVESNCLATTHPDLAKEWHPTRNGDLKPSNISYGYGKAWWKCDKGDDHEWITSVFHRVYGTNCPFCTLTPQSKQELTITFELIQFFKDINPKGFKTRVKGKLWSIDIYIPQLTLGIEFDGSYWHKDKQALDKLKTEKLEDEGFKIFRVREEPLKKIFDDDIMSKQPFNGKQVANDILTQIISRYTLEAKKITKIESYIAKNELQNEKGLDKYIDMILTEKAEKKN